MTLDTSELSSDRNNNYTRELADSQIATTETMVLVDMTLPSHSSKLYTTSAALLVLFLAAAYQFFFDFLKMSWLFPTYQAIVATRAQARCDAVTMTQNLDDY